MRSLPEIAYGVNTCFINSVSAPKYLAKGDVLNFIQLNLINFDSDEAVYVKISQHQEKTTSTYEISMYDVGSSEEIKARMTFDQLCKLEMVVGAMVRNAGELRGERILLKKEAPVKE